MLAHTDIGEKRILRRLFREGLTAHLVATPVFAVPLSFSHVTVTFFRDAQFWQATHLAQLGLKVMGIILLSVLFALLLSYFWFGLRSLISFVYREFCAYIAAAKRIPPAYLEDGRKLAPQLLVHEIPLSPYLFIRAGPRSPKNGPIVLFQRASLRVAP